MAEKEYRSGRTNSERRTELRVRLRSGALILVEAHGVRCVKLVTSLIAAAFPTLSRQAEQG